MIYLVMGVTGCGKTTVGRMLAERLDWIFLDADDFHTEANKEKMGRGIPLDNADRLPWLEAIHDELLVQKEAGHDVVLACSALKEDYRRRLFTGLEVQMIFLQGPQELIKKRLSDRIAHFAGEAILGNQFDVLEKPKNAIAIEIDQSPEKIVEEIIARSQL